MILHGSHRSCRKRIHQFIDHAIALYSEWVRSLFYIAFLSKGKMELLRTQFRIQSPEIFLILEAKRKQKKIQN